jgi:capping protein beta
MADPRLLAALDLMRRMPPSRMESSLEELVDLVPDLTDDLLNTVDQPLQLAKDSKGNAYLLCDYNRDGDSYRSPWTNQYDPPLEDGVLPSTTLRNMEVLANDIFDGYREMYYEGGASSVYFWDLDEPAFAACVLFKKDVETKIKGLNAGNWDAIHVIEVKPQSGGGKADYKLTSTIMLRVAVDHHVKNSGTGALNLSGSLTRQRETSLPAADQSARPTARAMQPRWAFFLTRARARPRAQAHVANMGRMVEEMENQMRDALQTIYFGKTKTVVNGLFKASGAAEEDRKKALQAQLQAEMRK